MSTPFKMKGISPLRQDIKKDHPRGSKTALDAVITSSGAGITKGPKRFITPTSKAKRRLPRYKEAWANMSKEERAKHGSYAAFVKAAKKYHAEKK